MTFGKTSKVGVRHKKPGREGEGDVSVFSEAFCFAFCLCAPHVTLLKLACAQSQQFQGFSFLQKKRFTSICLCTDKEKTSKVLETAPAPDSPKKSFRMDK